MDNDLDSSMVPDPDMAPDESGSSEPVNRPADNAEHGTPSDAIGGSFEGSTDATDFLGLGEEGFESLSTEDDLTHEEDQANSWLFTLEEDDEEEAGDFLEAPAADDSLANAMGAEQCLPSSPSEDSIFESGAELHGDLDPAGLNTSWSEETPKKTKATRIAIRVGAAALVLMLGFAGFQFFSAGSRISETATPNALAPGQNQTPGYRPRLTTPGEGEATGREFVSEADGTTPGDNLAGVQPELAPDPIEDRPKQAGTKPPLEALAVTETTPTTPELDPLEVLVARAGPTVVEPTDDRADVGSRNRWRRIFGIGDIDSQGSSTATDPSLDAFVVSGDPSDMNGALAVRPNWIDPGTADLAQYEFSSMRLASPDDLSNVWHGFEIPFEEINRTDRLITPMVGGVRVVLKTGELFEGRLYAVGEGRVWLDSNFGRTGLDGGRVETIVHILGGGGRMMPGRLGAEDLAGLPYVRVRALGGVFFAKLVYRDDATTTVVTREGTRITIPSDEVEILGNRPSVMIKQEET